MCIVVCDGLKGLPEAINTVWSKATPNHCFSYTPPPASVTWPECDGVSVESRGEEWVGAAPVQSVWLSHYLRHGWRLGLRSTMTVGAYLLDCVLEDTPAFIETTCPFPLVAVDAEFGRFRYAVERLSDL